MSVLENIRKRPGITIGVIGFALILFLFTGIDGCNRFVGGDRDTAVNVDGTKIKITEVNNRTSNANRNGQDFSQVEEATLQQMINQQLLEDEYNRLGIKVSDDEIQELFFGQTPDPYFSQRAYQYGFPSIADFYRYATSDADPSGQVRAVWDEFESDARDQIKAVKFQNLLGALTVNKLDAQAYYNDNASTSDLTVAKKDYATVADDQVEVTDKDIRDRYNRDKELYAIPTEARLVDYIVVRVEPSQADYLEAQQEVENAVADLKATPSTDAVATNNHFSAETLTGRADNIADNAIKNNIDAIVSDTVRVISFNNNTYTIAKLLGKEVKSDSIFIDIVAYGEGANADSIVNILNAGTPAADIADIQVTENQGINIVDPSTIAFRQQLLDATPGQYFTLNLDGQEFAPIVRVNKVNAPVTVYEIAKITRNVEPSSETYNNLNNDLRNYVAAHQDPKTFYDNALEAGYTPATAMLDPSRLSIAQLPSSAGAVKWAMEGKKGQLSDIYTDPSKSYLLAMAIEDIYDNGYVSVDNKQVADAIRAQLLAEKKGEKLLAEYNGKAKDVDGYAQIMGTAPETLQGSFGSNYIRGFQMGDPEMLAHIATAKEGELVGPFATRNSVVVFTVNGIQQHGREFNYDTDKLQAYNAEIAPVVQRYFPQALRAGKSIKYDILRFQQDN